MELIYEPVGWKNGEAGGTPVNEYNLNKMENGISDCVKKINELDKNKIGVDGGVVNGKLTIHNTDSNKSLDAFNGAIFRGDVEGGLGIREDYDRYWYITKEGIAYFQDLSLLSGGITKEHLDITVQESLEKADSITEIITDEWDANKTYTVGSYCIYSNLLWKCLVQNIGQTPTEGTYWTKTNVVSEIKTGSGEGGKGGIDYSLEEQDTGLKWIDGKTIYSKTIDCGTNFRISADEVPAPSFMIPDNMEQPINAKFFVTGVPYRGICNASFSWLAGFWAYRSSDKWDGSSDRHVYFYIEYTKI